MDTRKLFSNTIIYGFADAIVLIVGGLLLLPLYTRTLSQTEYGIYTVVRTNTEIFTYLIYLGLPSAVGRVYFLYKKKNQQIEFLSSVLTFYLLGLFVFCILLLIWGSTLWSALSPSVPAHPYIGFSIAIASVGFFSAIGTLWLRMEGRALAFATVQVVAAVVLVVTAVINLTILDNGLPGLLIALLISSACSALVLPWLFRWKFRLAIRWAHIQQSMAYGIPMMVGYLAYFTLNRMSTLILQRYVAIDQIAIFGLAQQLAMVVTIAGIAFGKAMQPVIFDAESAQVVSLLGRSEKLLISLMFCVTTVFLLFGSEMLYVVAPKSYGSGHEILLILLVGNFAYSFLQISNTTLLYFHRPKTSAAVSIAGACFTSLFSFWLIPDHHLRGAAFASLGAILLMILLSQVMARRVSGHSSFVTMFLALTAICLVASIAIWLSRQGFSITASISLKALFITLIFGTIYLLIFRKSSALPCVP